MKLIADLHIHSRFSRATSKELTIGNLEKYARIKGLNLLSTGDFTHPEWIKDLKSNLEEDSTGILKTKSNFPFVLQTEVSLIYTQDNKGRRIHNVVLAPDFDAVEQITEYLKKHGRVDYDGRPIFKIPCDEFVYELRKINGNIEVIPAHIWTPWFSLFGSMSGFDSVEECFKDQSKHIHALETGLSSDPAMNWRLSSLDKYALISCSDLHSFWPWRIGREATLFDCDLDYKSLLKAIRTKDGLSGTIEVDPNYGKYHLDGHRNCNVCMNPRDSIKIKKICPKCKRPLTIGVLHRVEELADREEGFKPKDAKEFYSLIPLSEIISRLIGSGIATKKTWGEYGKLVSKERSELDVLIKLSPDELKKLTDEKIAEAIINNRKGKIPINPGFDGEYGYPVFDKNTDGKKETSENVMDAKKPAQTGLTEFL